MTKYAIAILAALGSLVFGTGTAHADAGDQMYAVGSEIQPGTYRYTVTGNGWGDWHVCRDANCSDEIAMDVIEGEGHTGYMTVPANAKYVKTYYLTLAPMR